MWELKLYFYPSAGGKKKKKEDGDRGKLKTIPYPRLEGKPRPGQSESSGRSLSKPLLLRTKKQEDVLILHPPTPRAQIIKRPSTK